MFNTRSTKKELLDQEDIPEQDLFQNLRELNFINYWLGGYNISFNALKSIIKPDQHYVIVDIGCGGGDTLKQIKKWRTKHSYSIDLYGVDLKPVCIKYAENQGENDGISFICDDYRNVYRHVEKIDIIHACLFCHHLSEKELLELIDFSVQHKAILVVNDLERNPLAYYSIKWLTYLFSKSYLVKNDAPLSVLRGFKKKEWLSILNKSEAVHYSVKNKWAFRHQIIVDGTRA